MRTLLLLTLLAAGMPASAQYIFTVAGIPYNHRDDVDGKQAVSAPLGSVYGLLIDNVTGRLIFNDSILVLRLESDGSLVAVAGSGARSGAPPPASGALASAFNVSVFRGIAQDSAGALYLSEAAAGRVYRVAPDGVVTTFAGGGTLPPGFESDGGPATAARLSSPRGLVFDSKGNLDIAEVFCNCIRQVTPQGLISTLYTLPASPVPGRLPNIEGLAIDAQDHLYLTEWFGDAVVRVAADGSSATVIAGTGTAGFSGDGGPAAAAQLDGPSAVTLDANGNVFVADTKNHRIRKIAPDGTIATVAGAGDCGFLGDGGPAQTAQLCMPAGILFDNTGNLIIADYGNRRVRKVSAAGVITTIAGSGENVPAFSFPGSSGDGGPEIHATFNLVGGAVFDPAGNLYVAETQGNVIRKISPRGVVSTLPAQLTRPGPIAWGPDGALYVITTDSRVRKITPEGTVSLVAGTGTGTGLTRSQGDGGPAVNATLNEPGGVAFDRQGNLYIADTSNARVRKVDTNGIITTVAGPGQQGVDYYNAVAVDPRGNLYVAWTRALPPTVEATVNRVNADGSLTRVAGTGEPCMGPLGEFSGDRLPALQAHLCAVVGLSVDRNGLLYITEGDYPEVLRLNADSTIQRVAGSRTATDVGDGGPALQASLVGGQGWSPSAVTFDPAGILYLAEPGRNIVREVTSTPYVLQVFPAQIDSANTTLAVAGNFAEPFPYQVRISTADGGAWLSVNRVTGLTGESVKVTVQPGLPAGVYRGTVDVVVSLAGGVRQEVDVPVSVRIP